MTKAKRSLTRQALAFLLCAVMLVGVFPFFAVTAGDLLAVPTTVSLTDADGESFVSGQEVTIGEGFNIIYNYGTVESIDSSVKYALPLLSSKLEVIYEISEEEIVYMPLNDAGGTFLGTLGINSNTGAMTFQFDTPYDGGTLDGFFLQFAVQLNEEAVNIGDMINVSFSIEGGGTTNYSITVIDTEKDPPTIVKEGALSTDPSDSGYVEILWKITVNNANNPEKSIIIQDTWTPNQEYVEGSFCIGGAAVTEGLTLSGDGKGLQYERTNILPNAVDVITYKTRIKSSAFLDEFGVPLAGGNIVCKNTVQALRPGTAGIELTPPFTASYSHPIAWLYKTSGNVINRETGEMEWTIKIYNNGFDMLNVVLYDRLSPGVSIKDNTATIQIGSDPIETLTNFERIAGPDILYNSIEGQEYNLSYLFTEIDNVAVIKYRTIITNMAEYNAEENLPPDSIYDNRAFMAYQIPSGGGMSSIIVSPVIEKSGGYDTGLIGKKGLLEPAYHTINWTLTVNKNNETLDGVTVVDKLTYAAPVTSLPGSQLCNHVYDDSVDRNKPTYLIEGESVENFLEYDPLEPDKAFTYRLIPTGTEVYEIEFYLGDIEKCVYIDFRSTATDKIIFANNVSGSKYRYENKATLTTASHAFSYASADVAYTSQTIFKTSANSWFGRAFDTYHFDTNQFPWLIRVNTNQMEMKNIVLTDKLSEGTSLVDGKMILGTGAGSWYDLRERADTVTIPEGTTDSPKPYYTYDRATRELKIFLADITGDQVGTDIATKQIVFYVQLYPEHPIFNDNTRTDYIGLNNGVMKIPNSAKLENNYLNGTDAVTSGTKSYSVSVQHLLKTAAPHNNGGNYSIDYSLSINRIQKELPETTVIKDIIPVGLRLDPSTLRLYEATVTSPDDFYVLDDGTNGTLVKGAEVDASLYHLDTTVNDDNTTTMQITLPENSGTKMYIAEYSCDVTDISKAPFTNNAAIEGITESSTNQTVAKIKITGASAGGTMRDAVKTEIIVEKRDANSHNPITDAEFGIYHNGLLIEKKTCDSNGRIVFENLNRGYTYTITELKAGVGYLDPVNITETVVATDISAPVELVFDNAPIEGTVQFFKTDEGGTALSGAVFGIWNNAADIGSVAPFDTATSKSNGAVEFYGLSNRTYYIAEITPPDGYLKSDKVIVAEMNASDSLEKLYLLSDPSQADITNFVNAPLPSATLIVAKEVSGNLGNRKKDFTFNLLIDATAFMPNGSTLSGKKTLADGTEESVTITVGTTYTFSLAHREYLTVEGLKYSMTYTVSENDYSSDGYNTTYSTTQGVVTTGAISGRSVTETLVSGINVEAFYNNAYSSVPTGITVELCVWLLIVLLALTGGAVLLHKRRVKVTE